MTAAAHVGTSPDASDVGAIPADVDVSTLSRDELIAHNLKVVEAHFHNENPESIDKAIALYGPDIVWEAPNRGQVYTDRAQVREAYMAIFRTVHFNRTITLRRFATETHVFDDQLCDLTVVGDEMPNLGFPPGARISMRLVHCFEMKDGKIAREIAYEMSRPYGGPADFDSVPAGSPVEEFPDGPHFADLAPIRFDDRKS
ncbi:nuclear transport factor 2 family protein [Pseudonocardia kujensis]|uniref:nuclear transport factor 2 family protein n=1 Tax=Pseudonocardia kujensis TaxID=1128675 RepID=UPI001E5ABD11|nr:nuclear transport factor 2 family protein [Pseudonocardia kujensis]MCE0764908.1 nuclear transport factor 2 family protein [Pseudonocardia kujensis]